jgi:hypothetical protein
MSFVENIVDQSGKEIGHISEDEKSGGFELWLRTRDRQERKNTPGNKDDYTMMSFHYTLEEARQAARDLG